MRSALAVIVLVLAHLSWTPGAAGQSCNPSLRHQHYHELVSVEKLPSSVPRPEDRVTLFADFAHRETEYIPVYLVNMTDTAVVLPSQDQYLYLKLENLDDRGKWVRAQGHGYSWCGNSYYPVSIPARQAMALRGYQPLGGREAPVRFALYGGERIVSNSGLGTTDSVDVELCRSDKMYYANASFESLARIALGRDASFGREAIGSRRHAVLQLRRYPTAASLRVLALMTSSADSVLQMQARHSLQLILEAPRPDPRKEMGVREPR